MATYRSKIAGPYGTIPAAPGYRMFCYPEGLRLAFLGNRGKARFTLPHPL